MNMNYNYPTTIFKSISPKLYKSLVEKYIFIIFVKMKNCKYYQKYLLIGSNTSKYCSHIIVVHIHANGSACHHIANGIKPVSYSKKTDKHAANCSKAVCCGVK